MWSILNGVMIITFSGQWIPIEIVYKALDNKNRNRYIFLKLFGHKMRRVAYIDCRGNSFFSNGRCLYYNARVTDTSHEKFFQ
jgi:hypothetical protein